MSKSTVQSQPRIGLVQFPGSNCDTDCFDALKRHFDITVQPVWHTETKLPALDGIILPGGFSYGDYLRAGTLAAHSPIMSEVKLFAKAGGAVIGICNGFQILTESRLLPGVLLRNISRTFNCRFVDLKPVPGPSGYQKILFEEMPIRSLSRAGHDGSAPSLGGHDGRILSLPIAHGEGRYYISQDGLKRLQDNGQVVLQYADESGRVTDAANPNGSLTNIAGICSENGRVFGLMPHPERATDVLMGGSEDGLLIWKAFLSSCM